MTLPPRLEDITLQTLQALVDEGVRERKFIEYKRDLPDLKAESHKKEFLNDVSSFANASGGDLVFGIEVDKEQKDLPTKVVGIPVANEDALQLQVQGIVAGGLDPRVPKFETHFVPTEPGRGVLVLRVGKSWRGPHMVKETGRFFSRTSSGKFTLDVREIRDAMLAGEEIGKRMANFRAERIAAIMENGPELGLEDGAKVVVHLMPEDAFARNAPVDLRPIDRLWLLTGSDWNLPPSHNFEGVIVAQSRGGASARDLTTQVFRNGVIESVNCSFLKAKPKFPEYVESFVAQFCRSSFETLEALGLSGSVYVAISFLGVRGYEFQAESDLRFTFTGVPLRRDHLLLPEQRFETTEGVSTAEFGLSAVYGRLQPALDVLWNAFGVPRCLNYDERGRRLRVSHPPEVADGAKS